MTVSQRIARIIGPALVAIAVTEAFNLKAFAGNPAPVVYLNGTLLFVAGLAIVQAPRPRTILLTLTGWVCLLGGLYRMAAPQAPQISDGLLADAVFGLIVVAGAALSYQGYFAGRSGEAP
jgi:hypothetical protein